MRLGEVAIVTGGGNGIGRSVCLRFAQAGISIAIVDCDVKGAEGVRDQVKGTGGDAEAYGVDVRNATEVKKVVDEIARRY